MINLLFNNPLLAAVDTETFTRTLEFSFPESGWAQLLSVVGIAAMIAFVVWLYLKDTQGYSWFWKTWLLGLRLAVVVGLVIIALNPHERTERTSYRPSKVAILVDTSMSMEKPFKTPKQGDDITEIDSRSEVIRKLITDSKLISELRKKHQVEIYTFDEKLEGNQQTFSSADPRMQKILKEKDDLKSEEALDSEKWKAILAPRGSETRLGDSLSELISQIESPTLSGIVILSDGQLTAGVDASTVNQRIKESKIRLIAGGIGGTEPDINVAIADLTASKDVQVGDAFDIEVAVIGQGVANQSLIVELYSKTPDQTEPTLVESQETIVDADNTPVKLKFTQTPDAPSETTYTVKVKPPEGIQEIRDNDNQRKATVIASDEPTKVLMIAGTPKRDYRFLRNVLYRHKSVNVDVWLQSTEPGISQESDQLLFDFPEKKSELFEYDVIITFDADWELISPEGQKNLEEWVFQKGGGFIFVAGEIFTPYLASHADEFPEITTLLPVELDSLLLDLRTRDQSNQPWPIQFTADGKTKPFFSITDDSVSSEFAWDELPGLYRVYPTLNSKNSTIYAYHGDSRIEDQQRILMAGQSCNKGFSVYLGSAETYRLRSFDDQYFDRFWTALIRELAKQRRGKASRAEFLNLPTSSPLGQMINFKVRVVDPEYKPYEAESIELKMVKPDGNPVFPSLRMAKDPKRPGEYRTEFRPPTSGQYRLQLPIPESDEVTEKLLEVASSQSENLKTIQDVKLLRDITLDTGGQYLPVSELETKLPELLPNKGEEFQISERIRTLWDKQWVMLLLASLLSAEWLTRKLLQLA